MAKIYPSDFVGPLGPDDIRSNMLVMNDDGTVSRRSVDGALVQGPLTAEEQAFYDAHQPTDTNTLGNVSGGSTPTAGSGGTTFTPVSFLGQIYNDPDSLAQAKRGYIDTLNHDQLSSLDRALMSFTGATDPSATPDINSVGADSTLGRSKSSLLKQVADLIDSYVKGEKTAKGNLNSYYANLGDAYQSSQGVREAETTDQFAKARTDAQTQQTEGLAGLQRTLSDYLNADQTNRTNLARNYVTTLDSAQNASEADLASGLGRNITPADVNVASPTVTATATQDNTGLLGALRKAANGVFRLQTPNGQTDTSNVLKYLYNLG